MEEVRSFFRPEFLDPPRRYRDFFHMLSRSDLRAILELMLKKEGETGGRARLTHRELR